jgi:galactoside O-acetyltransferase
VEVGEESQLFCHLVVQTPHATIRIGRRTQIGGGDLIAACGIDVGDDVLVGWDVTLLDNDSHSLRWKERASDVAQCAIDYRKTPQDFARNKDWSVVPMAPIRIENRVWIGFGATVLKGVTIGEGAVVAAKSVVTRDVSPYALVAGNPARVIRQLEE